MRTWILGTAMVLVVAGCGSAHNATVDGGDDAAGGSGTNGSSGTKGGSGNGSGSGGTGTGRGSGGTGATVGDGTQLAMCAANADCDTGLGCYTFGRYCSKQCAADGDCTSLGANYTCYMAAGGMMGGGMMGRGTGGMTAGSGGSGAATASGVCRVSCMNAMDTSCPTGLMCLNVGGTFRCGYPPTTGGTGGMTGGTGGRMGMMMQTPGTTPAFGQCMGGGCLAGLTCSARRGTGFCTQTCMSAAECTNNPGSGNATQACARAGRCTLSCIEGEANACPTGMTCMAGFGPGMGAGDADGGAMGTCNYAN